MRPRILALVLVLALVGTSAAVALAATADPGSDDRRASATHGAVVHRGGPHALTDERVELLRSIRADVVASFADRLDTTPARVTAAARAVLAARLDRAVARDRIDRGERRAVLRAFDRQDPRIALRALMPRFRAWHDRARDRDRRPPSARRVRAKRDALVRAFAAELDREPAAVRSAIRAELDERLAIAVRAGYLPQRFADAILRAWDTGEVPRHRGFGHHG